MKRTRLLRKQALRRTKALANQRKTKRENRVGDPEYLAFIRSLPCCVCRASPPSHPHHSTGAGMGTKSSDRETMPLCFKHHRAFHDAKGPFEYLTRKERRTWQELQVQQCQELYASLGA